MKKLVSSSESTKPHLCLSNSPSWTNFLNFKQAERTCLIVYNIFTLLILKLIKVSFFSMYQNHMSLLCWRRHPSGKARRLHRGRCWPAVHKEQYQVKWWIPKRCPGNHTNQDQKRACSHIIPGWELLSHSAAAQAVSSAQHRSQGERKLFSCWWLNHHRSYIQAWQ